MKTTETKNTGTFKVGDKVRCVDAWPTSRLKQGATYVVSDGGSYTIGLEDVVGNYYARRFELVDDETGGFKVGDKVRFITDNSNGGVMYGGKGTLATVITAPRSGWKGRQEVTVKLLSRDQRYNPSVFVDEIELVEDETGGFKDGDLVRFIDTTKPQWHFKPGDVGAVLARQPLGQYKIAVGFPSGAGFVDPRMIELVAPDAPKVQPIQSVKVSAELIHEALTLFVKDTLGIDATVTKITEAYKKSVELHLSSEVTA